MAGIWSAFDPISSHSVGFITSISPQERRIRSNLPIFDHIEKCIRHKIRSFKSQNFIFRPQLDGAWWPLGGDKERNFKLFLWVGAKAPFSTMATSSFRIDDPAWFPIVKISSVVKALNYDLWWDQSEKNNHLMQSISFIVHPALSKNAFVSLWILWRPLIPVRSPVLG